jgi:hypothetical protein
MNRIFCVSCGHKLLYEVSAPKFCSSCGENPYGIKSLNVKKSEEEEEDDDFGGIEISEAKLRKLKMDISVESFGRHSTLDEIWSNPAPREDFQRRAFNGPSGKDLLDLTIKECGPSRPTDINE